MNHQQSPKEQFGIAKRGLSSVRRILAAIRLFLLRTYYSVHTSRMGLSGLPSALDILPYEKKHHLRALRKWLAVLQSGPGRRSGGTPSLRISWWRTLRKSV
ncbi:predicted protein [Histoplasma capsulatum G186AR]|uniref:Uncharacterized protein n=1 Tax=Ajellomyces capsulatus (strain G186AR / H82 / ATCC MYA-2454 / RMSCC 2432) TaxID=447093 RepID=C0NW63_AJECG|nr:uncharacterized protein HCBG_07393 [Histoplasma capsulatum G186AR]EEH04168.1 predicted protein [Histoplasma capsulatum G186AR]